MFSSAELISFVFANENDVYYGDDLIKRDLNQYLWDRLHQNYDAVYFLSAKGDTFAVRTYGDLCCKGYVPGKKTIFSHKTAQSDFGNWLQRQLQGRAGETAAFVCSLEDFCAVLEDVRWEEVLEEIAEMKNRTGIFVLTASATAERTAHLLLKSPVFELLHETAVTDLRGGALRELYGALKKRKWDNCVFLNTFSWERLRAMLLHLIVENPDRCESCGRLDTLTEYLYTYCRNPEFADGEGIFHREMPVDYLLYANLYDQLSAERTWKRFETACRNFQTQESFHKTLQSAETRVPVLRDRNSYAGRCMKIRLPRWLRTQEDVAEHSAALLCGICDSVSMPMNRVENPEIMAAAEKMLNQLDAVQDCDSETYIQVLESLKFCVSYVYTDSKEKTGKILEVIRRQADAISITHECFVGSRDLEQSRKYMTEGQMHSTVLQQMEAKLNTMKKLKKRYRDLVSAMELGLKMPETEGNIKSMLEDLEQSIREFDRSPQTGGNEPETDTEEEPEFVFTPGMFSYRPPVV